MSLSMLPVGCVTMLLGGGVDMWLGEVLACGWRRCWHVAGGGVNILLGVMLTGDWGCKHVAVEILTCDRRC